MKRKNRILASVLALTAVVATVAIAMNDKYCPKVPITDMKVSDMHNAILKKIDDLQKAGKATDFKNFLKKEGISPADGNTLKATDFPDNTNCDKLKRLYLSLPAY